METSVEIRTGAECKHDATGAHQPKPGCACQNLLPKRKVHSLIGLFLTMFLLVHMAIGATGLWPVAYRLTIARLEAHKTGTSILLLAVVLPLAVQAITGLYLLRKHGFRYNVKKCKRGGKLRFFLQRVSAVSILSFVAFHFISLRRAGLLPASPADAFHATTFAFRAISSLAWFNSIWVVFSLLALWSLAFHVANGGWTGSVVWNLIRPDSPNRYVRVVCCGFGVLLIGLSTAAWFAFVRGA